MTETELLMLDDVTFVEQAYKLALGRAADPKGMLEYLQRVRGGAAKDQILAEMRSSTEGRAYAARNGIATGAASAPRRDPARVRSVSKLADLMLLPSDAFIEQAYRLVLGRPADDSGRQNYQVALLTGVHRLEMLRQLLESEEGRRRAAPLPEVRAAIEQRRLLRLPLVRQAVRAWTLVRRRVGVGPPRAAPSRAPAVAVPAAAVHAHPTLKPVIWPAPSPHREALPTMNDATDRDGPTTSGRLAAAGQALQDDKSGPTAATTIDTQRTWALQVEKFVGATLHGWSFVEGEQGTFSIEFGGRMLGHVVPRDDRPDVQDQLGLTESRLGFSAILGGVLQFSAMAADCPTMRLSHAGDRGGVQVLNLHEHLAEALTFSPMRALMRPLLGSKAGSVRSMRLVSPTEASILFEADQKAEGGGESIFIDLYQEASPGSLTRIARFAVELSGQIVDLGFRMIDASRPVLMVLTDGERALIATDCFPLPELMSEAHAPLIEYHVVLETGKPAYGVAAKIARTFLDSAIKARLAGSTEVTGPHAATTCLMLYTHDSADVQVAECLGSRKGLAAEAVLLDLEGDVHRASGEKLSLVEFIGQSPAQHLLLLEVDARLRPDFWSVLDHHRFRLAGDPDLVHWHALWLDGTQRPQVVKSAPLLHPTFDNHQRIETRSMIVRKDVLRRAAAEKPGVLRSGRLVLEEAFSGVAPDRVVQVPIVMDIVRAPIVPLVQTRYLAEQVTLPRQPARAGQPAPHAGVSVIVNYRDGVNDTLRCMESLHAQQANGPLEIVLVNNGSTAQSVNEVLGRARDLFGVDNVRPIDYPHRFNHSTQCNIAAVAARHDLLLMLSNDSYFRTPQAVARSAEVAMVPWVGSCGYRIVGNEAAKGRLQSLGLALNERRYLFSGGSPVTTGLPPDFALGSTFEVVGNTFAAVMLRREVYVALDGLDSVAFPTNYNDIDFSFRASNAGYRHVVIGSEIVEHMGRGSREADQDLPIDQRIVERAPRLDVLARVGFQQL